MEIQRLRGTDDLFPEETKTWNRVEEIFKGLYHRYNYWEIRTPVLEPTELFQRGIGESTDIVQKEMYTFSDRGDRSITLRPENTASVVRAYLEESLYGQAQPLKYYYFGPMFRYERPQTGRKRQFYQTGIEALGSSDPALDAEVIILARELLSSLGLENNQLHLNSIGCLECRGQYLDGLRERLEKRATDLCSDCQRRLKTNPLRILDCKNKECGRGDEELPLILDYLCQDCNQHFAAVKNYLQVAGIDYRLDPKMVRGLDYYTRTAFEIIDSNLGAQDALLGGGRYDGLAAEIGGQEVPGIGFAMGLERLLLSLQAEERAPEMDDSMDCYLITIGSRARYEAFRHLKLLREAGIKAEMDYGGRSVKGQMKDADRKGAAYGIIIGENELAEGVAMVRSMDSGEEHKVSLDELIVYCQD